MDATKPYTESLIFYILDLFGYLQNTCNGTIYSSVMFICDKGKQVK